MNDGFEEIPRGELRKLLATLGHEDHFFAITGIDPSNSNAASQHNNSAGGGKKGGKKRKKT
jgi:hypothetical protein